MVAWALARKDLNVLIRDRRAVVILLVMPLVFIVVLGISLGEGFGQKPDDRLRVSIVDLDVGYIPTVEEEKEIAAGGLFAGGPSAAKKDAPKTKAAGTPIPESERFPKTSWAKVVLEDLSTTAGIRVEIIPSRQKAEELVRKGQRSAVLVFGPEFSKRVHNCSFLKVGINPFYRDGIDLKKIDAEILKDPTQLSAASIIEQVAQVSSLRVILPWMIGRAFEIVGNRLGPLVKSTIKAQFPNYDLTAKTWASLTKQEEKKDVVASATVFEEEVSSGLLNRGSFRYQVLVPSYTVMFAFFLVLTCGWLFASERRQGTLKRLRAAPIGKGQIIVGKLIPCFLLSVFQGVFLFSAGRFLFGMSWGNSPAWLLAVVFATALATTGMALLLSTVARTETQVLIYGSMLVLAMAGISGCLMPRELMPEQMKQISRITPHAWALDAYAQLLLNPEPNIMIVFIACVALTAFGMGFLLLSLLFLRLDH
ncbi:MAG: ABC transporter permease [Planctomycetota bacterium]